MRLMRLFAADVREGWQTLWKWHLAAVVLFALVIASLHVQAGLAGASAAAVAGTVAASGGAAGTADVAASAGALRAFTLGDYLVNYLAGMKEFTLIAGEPFRFPVAWAVMVLLAAYLTLWYPYRDLMGFGRLVVVAGGSRWAWWGAKCLWVVVFVAAFFALAGAVALAWTVASGGELTLRISDDLPELLAFRPSQVPDPPYEAAGFLLAAPLAMVALVLVQLLLSLLLRPVVSFAVTVGILFMSAFYMSPWLLGNHLMAARTSSLMIGGYDPAVGVALSVAVAVVVVVAGGFVFSRIDILNKEDLS